MKLERTVLSDLETPILEIGEDPGVGDLVCSYRNGSDRMVILRCLGPDGFFLERVVFPFEVLNFDCPQDCEVKIWTHGLGGPELVESLQADDLILDPKPSAPNGKPTSGLGLAGDFLESATSSPWLHSL
jgi:hypothetical protein